MNILVTGGAGFIGSHLCEKFVKGGHAVTCVDNLLTGSKKNIHHLLDNEQFHFIEHDVTQPISNIKYQISNIDLIYHLASPASPNKNSPYSYLAYPIKTLLVNSQGTKNMLDLARKKNARFVYASTSEVYGDPQEHPQTEDYWGNINPNGIRSCYDEGKRFGEAITVAYYRKYSLDTRIARIFNTYGPHMLPEDGRVVLNFIVQSLGGEPLTIYGDGTQTRSFCYITDLVDALVRLALMPEAEGKVINLGNPTELTILELAKKIQKLTTSRAGHVFKDLPVEDPHKRRPDITRAKRILGWEPKIDLDKGLQNTIEFFGKI